jgi:hypothetical protein
MTQTSRTSQLGSAAASLFVAYMLVLQGVVASFAFTARMGEASFLANAICLEKTDGQSSRDGSPVAPGPKQSHASSCCVFHCSGAGAPPPSSYADGLERAFHAQIAWTGAEPEALYRWPTLPVGSRAPPHMIS